MEEKKITAYLYLDEKFRPTYLPGIFFTKFKFSGGETHIKLDNETDYTKYDRIVISNRFVDGDDIMEVLIAKDALQRKGIKNFDLIIPYIPYARQDRVCTEGESFTLKIFTDLINSANFDKVIVLDAHSDVAPALINNCVNISNSEYVKQAYYEQTDGEVILISPDSGSNKKCNKLFEQTKVFSKLVKCDKIRNVHNGDITGFEVFATDLNGRTCMIVDDICDGGRTFIGIAEELKKKNAGDIYLFVTHGIFSYGSVGLGQHFKKIFCTNSFKDIDDKKIKQFEIKIIY
jgi:ribose-phosphate pyrophosphokinase